jgi:hypothetical protein
MLSILNHKGNANQNYISFHPSEISSYPILIGNHQEDKQQMLVRMRERKEPSYIAGNVN